MTEVLLFLYFYPDNNIIATKQECALRVLVITSMVIHV